MELHVRITGLCLIVPQIVDGRQLYHILMPRTSHHPKPHRHDAVLSYLGASQTYDLGCHSLDLRGIKARAGEATLDTVVDIGRLNADQVRASQLGPKPAASVFARVTLASPTRTASGPTAIWKTYQDATPMESRPSTHHMTWIYDDLDKDSLALSLERLEYASACPGTPNLDAPKDEGGVYCISIYHLPPQCEGLPCNDVPVGGFAPHFSMYGDLFDQPKKPRIQLESLPASLPYDFTCRGAPVPMVPPLSETAYNCMLAQAGVK